MIQNFDLIMTFLIILSIPVIILIYIMYYYRFTQSKEFKALKQMIQLEIAELDQMINDFHSIKIRYIGVSNGEQIYKCSRAIVKNSEKDIFKYIIKYFNISTELDTIYTLKQYKKAAKEISDLHDAIRRKHFNISSIINKRIPYLLNPFRNSIFELIGFNRNCIEQVVFNYDKYILIYTSPIYEVETENRLVLDVYNTEQFIRYIQNIIDNENFEKRQRRLMTDSLRRQIILRDHYTCQMCGKSQLVDKNLLLEVDHIIPVSKGGKTVENNLQTLCRSCNRHKSNHV